jgi:NAD(P)-dependent dehydrogenase (short-subunit alcohol dehydrogenase family)
MTPATDSVCFSMEDLLLFKAASGDTNPIHSVPEFASKTSYGQCLVFGALGALACLGRMSIPAEARIDRINCEFHRPMFVGVHYRAAANATAGNFSGQLFDGSVLVLTLTLTTSANAPPPPPAIFAHSLFELDQPVKRIAEDLVPGFAVSGRYRAGGPALEEILKRWNVTASPFCAQLLIWGSYFTGMEVPGLNALFFRLSLRLTAPAASARPLRYESVIKRFDPRLQQVCAQVTLSQETTVVAEGECWSFLRGSLPSSSDEKLETYLQPSRELAGKVALVIGASRGLGASIAQCLALVGTTVIATGRSVSATHLPLPAAATGTIIAEAGDAGSVAWLEAFSARLLAEHGKLDILVCNAFPAIVPLRMEPNSFGRIEEYVRQASGLVLAPLSVFLGLLNRSHGTAVVISSSAVGQMVREWPHYIAAKRAVEVFAEIAPLQYPQVASLIVRPEKLLTEMTNTPIGRKGAAPPERMAAAVVRRLTQPFTAGTSQLLPPLQDSTD